MFKLETELVASFLSLYKCASLEVLVTELPIRFGNIDIVSIKNSRLPFSSNQIEILSKPSAALLFTKIKNERPVSKGTLNKRLGLSEATINQALTQLLKSGLIVKVNDECYIRKVKFVFPKTTVTGYEAKLTDFNKAFYQAKSNREFVDYSYLVFPLEMATRIFEKKLALMENNGIGLMGVTKDRMVTLLKADKSKKMKDNIRLLNLTKVNQLCNAATGP